VILCQWQDCWLCTTQAQITEKILWIGDVLLFETAAAKLYLLFSNIKFPTPDLESCWCWRHYPFTLLLFTSLCFLHPPSKTIKQQYVYTLHQAGVAMCTGCFSIKNATLIMQKTCAYKYTVASHCLGKVGIWVALLTQQVVRYLPTTLWVFTQLQTNDCTLLALKLLGHHELVCKARYCRILSHIHLQEVYIHFFTKQAIAYSMS